jgi:hypothetical protein
VRFSQTNNLIESTKQNQPIKTKHTKQTNKQLKANQKQTSEQAKQQNIENLRHASVTTNNKTN